MAALILAIAVIPTNPTSNSLSKSSPHNIPSTSPSRKTFFASRNSKALPVRAAKKNSDQEESKPSFSIGDQLLDYIEGGPKLRKWYGAPDQLPKDGGDGELDEDVKEPIEEEEGPRDAALVTDADSETGQLLVLALILKRMRVRALVRDAKAATAAFGPYVEPVVGDVGDPTSLKKALLGVRAVICPTKVSCRDGYGVTNLIIKMHQPLSSLCIAPHFAPPFPFRPPMSKKTFVVAYSTNCSNNFCAQQRTIVISRGTKKQKLGIQCGDEARVPMEIRNAWETDLADEDVRVLAKFQSLYNFVQVLEVSRRADHSMAGCRLLLLDRPGNIQSVYNPYKVMTDSYYDVFATLPPLLPNGPVGILGLGAGTAARILLHFWPQVELHGWELDPSVIMVARKFFDLAELEQGKHPERRASMFALEGDIDILPDIWRDNDLNNIGRLVVHVGDALACEAPIEGFAGLIVDMFSDGAVIPALQQPQIWQRLRQHLKPGGRIMVNCGGSCVEADKSQAKDGETTMEETLEAMLKVFPDEVFQFKLPGKGNNSVALSGPCPDLQAWEKTLPPALEGLCDWVPVS